MSQADAVPHAIEVSMRLRKAVPAAALSLACSLLPSLASAATEPVTGLPLFPGATLVERQPPAVECGITIHGVQYESNEKAPKAVDFFRKALPGASTWTVPAAMIITNFLAPDGKAAVRVLGTPDGMYLVYWTLSKPRTVAQLRAGPKC
jgi:hypothetical protein